MNIDEKIAHRFKDADNALYASHEKVYAREVDGKFQSMRRLAAWCLLGLYYGLAWLPWEGRQAVLFDLPARQFHIFGLTFWPQDFFFLAWLLVMAALSLFFFTALAGRLWCGYACPQTVWTEVFVALERFVEGSRQQQLKLKAMPWNAFKWRKRIGKQILWVSFALWTGFTFVGYFTPIQELAAKTWQSLHGNMQLGGWEMFWVLFYSFATYGNAGFLREQVCLYMCPYARFQSAMLDKDSLVISYDSARGEPRQKGKRELEDNAGDCVDCSLCVQVCPTGIDIRDGLQYECIGCAACIDACDQVMDKVLSPRGLIRYTTENSLAQKPSSIIRPRILLYGAVLSALALSFVIAIALRAPLAVNVLHDRNPLYRVTGDSVHNAYTLKIMNKDRVATRYTINVLDLDSAEIKVHRSPLVQPGTLAQIPVTVSVPLDPDHASDHASRSRPAVQAIRFRISADSNNKESHAIEERSRFFLPLQ